MCSGLIIQALRYSTVSAGRLMDLRGLDMMVKGLRDGDGFNDKVRDDLLIKYLMAGHQRRAFFSYLKYKRCAREARKMLPHHKTQRTEKENTSALKHQTFRKIRHEDFYIPFERKGHPDGTRRRRRGDFTEILQVTVHAVSRKN